MVLVVLVLVLVLVLLLIHTPIQLLVLVPMILVAVLGLALYPHHPTQVVLPSPTRIQLYRQTWRNFVSSDSRIRDLSWLLWC